MNTTSKILTAINVIAFSKTGEREFTALSQCPVFFDELYKFSLGDRFAEFHSSESINTYYLADAFPYIEYFLIDADTCWKNQNTEAIKSGIWAENGQDQEQVFQFEAQALWTDDTPVFLIHNLTPGFATQQDIFQKARNIALANERLKSELNTQQRVLQSGLQKQVKSHLHEISYIEPLLNQHEMGVLICKPGGFGELKNRALRKLTASSDPENKSILLKQWISEAEDIYPEMQRVIESGDSWEGEFQSHFDSGFRWIRLSVSSVCYSNNEIAYHVCVINDIHQTQNNNYDEITGITSNIDHLTNLPNRKAFWATLKKTIVEAIQNNKQFSLVYLDLDHFQHINVDAGHNAGDLLLNTVAARLSKIIKYSDYIAHLGGDEYAAIIKAENHDCDALTVAKRLLTAISKPVCLGDDPIIVTASAGIAAFPEDSMAANELLSKADLAMSHAKSNGRNQAHLFNENIELAALDNLRLEKDVQRAIDNDEFFLVYQPIISFKEDKQLRAEALIRWQHPEKGLLSPNYFIKPLEESGQIIDLSKWVFNKACERIRAFSDQGISIVLSINVSAKEISAPEFFSDIVSIMVKHRVEPKNINIEITETAFFDDIDGVAPILEQLKSFGLLISLDDFGAGFSSLNYLKQLPADKLKIDRSFIKDLPGDEDSKIISSSVIKLAHKFNLSVVAEGIESKEQADLLQEMGCEYAQGYFFHKPLEEQKFLEICRKI